MAHGQDADAPEPDEVHVSPDGALKLVVFYGEDPMLGFGGLEWHVHGAKAEIAAWVADILAGRRPIIEAWKDGARVDAWTPEGNDFDFDGFVADSKASGDPDEEWRLRRWDG
ncbi:MAG: hypothetical protein QM759_14540 [Terricaulis sp.]